MKRKRRTPWDRICRAAERGSGLRLSPEDVDRLYLDDAIRLRGHIDGSCFRLPPRPSRGDDS